MISGVNVPAATFVQAGGEMARASQALAGASSDRDLRLLQEYTRTCRQRGGIVLGLGDDVVMLNDHARQALPPADQAALRELHVEARD